MKNLKKVLAIILVAGVLAVGLIGLNKKTNSLATKDAWGYIPTVADTI